MESKAVPGTDVYIKGKYDLLVKRDDGSFLLIDLKISQPQEDKIDKYKTQLNAYKFALENPKYGKAFKITKLGLLIFYPDKVKFEENEAILYFPPKWLEVPLDVKGFTSFAKEIDKLLNGETPAENPNCKWCQYRHVGETLAHPESEPEQEEIPF